MHNNTKISGYVDIKIIDVSGKVVRRIRERNLVVDAGRVNMANLLAGAGAGTKVSKIGVGTNAAASTLADTALTDPFEKPLTGYTVTGTKVVFNYSIDYTEANGKNITEFGLLTDTNVLFARKNITDAVAKSSAFKVEGTWEISII